MNFKKIAILTLVSFSICIVSFGAVSAIDNNILSVAAINGKTQGYSLFWSKALGHARIERSSNNSDFQTIGETDLNYYVDFDVKKDVSYKYRVVASGKTITSSASDLLSGKSLISDIRIEAGATSKAESSVVLSFKTDKLSKGQIFYGESLAYTDQTEIDNSLNQSHTVLIEKLKPNATYHFKIKSVDKDDKNPTESDDQVFTTSAPPNEVTIFQIIIKALSQAFAGFQSWFKN